MSEVGPKNSMRQTNCNKIRIYLYTSYAEAKNRKWRRENDALNWHVNSGRHRRSACSLHEACMQGVDALLLDAATCSRASTPGIDSCFSMEVATLRASCSLHAGFMSIAFLKCRSYFSKCSLHFARITPVCSLRTTVCRMQQDAAGCMRPAGSLHAGRIHL